MILPPFTSQSKLFIFSQLVRNLEPSCKPTALTSFSFAPYVSAKLPTQQAVVADFSTAPADPERSVITTIYCRCDLKELTKHSQEPSLSVDLVCTSQIPFSVILPESGNLPFSKPDTVHQPFDFLI